MQPAQTSSIRQKLTRLVVGACTACIVLACTAIVLYDTAVFRQQVASDLHTVAEITASNLTAALSFKDSQSATDVLNSLRRQQHVIQACVYSVDRRLFAKYSRDSARVCPALGPSAFGIQFQSSSVSVADSIAMNTEALGTIVIESDLGALHAQTMRFVGIAVFVVLCSILIAYPLASRLQRFISEPILSLAATAAAISSKKDYSLRAEKRSSDEIGSLVDGFNDMLARIQEHESALRSARDELEIRVAERTRELSTEIAERKQAERELEERESFLDSLIKNTPVGIVATDAGDLARLCNASFERMFGYREPEIVGQTLANLIATPDLRAEVDTNRNNLRIGKTTRAITKRKRRDGSLLDVEAFAVPLGPREKPTGGLIIYLDITERKQAEEALLSAKEAAEAANRAKSEFLANMSHEIRTPMNGIMGMTELVLDTNLDPEQRNYLNLAKVSADSLLSLINDILDYSKIEAGKLEIEAIDFNLGDTMKTLSLRAHQKGLELAFEIDPSVPDALIGDPGRLRQVIINLVGNGIKFTEHGEVVVYVRVQSHTQDRIELHFTVADTGIGIPAEKQSTIFEAFNQADGSMTRKYGGTGLGLTISSRLIALMGGKIWVESQIGKGSQFHFTAQFGLQQEAARKIVPTNPERLRDMRVLVVDDNLTNRQILAKILESWRMHPTLVDSGAQAVISLAEAESLGRTFPLILLDAQMPGMDGFALAETIKRNPRWSSCTIMMLSSAGQRGDALRCRDLGIAAYFTKPVRKEELFDAILAALATRADTERPRTLVTRHSVRENRGRLTILLVEDNAVNQLVALRLLEKHGHHVTVAANGRKALEAVAKKMFDVILMDIQMPEMDGWEATSQIREDEKKTGKHIPIVAMTAHAMKGDEERCRAAGMDHYLTKPLRTKDLFALLEKITNRKPTTVQVGPSVGKTVSDAIDLASALERLDGDRALFDELTHLFEQECPKVIEAMRHAIATRDARSLEQQAHALKGSSANLGALAVSHAAAEIERIARSDAVETASDQFRVLQDEIERLFSGLEVLRHT
jgi:two-component system, sensor histidine kinase and response regulator